MNNVLSFGPILFPVLCTNRDQTILMDTPFLFFCLPFCPPIGPDVNRKCWYMTTKGMHAVGQAEVVILLQCLPDEKTIPRDILTHFVHLYQEALTGGYLLPLAALLVQEE